MMHTVKPREDTLYGTAMECLFYLIFFLSIHPSSASKHDDHGLTLAGPQNRMTTVNQLCCASHVVIECRFYDRKIKNMYFFRVVELVHHARVWCAQRRGVLMTVQCSDIWAEGKPKT